jgi:hypothetical protein
LGIPSFKFDVNESNLSNISTIFSCCSIDGTEIFIWLYFAIHCLECEEGKYFKLDIT